MAEGAKVPLPKWLFLLCLEAEAAVLERGNSVVDGAKVEAGKEVGEGDRGVGAPAPGSCGEKNCCRLAVDVGGGWNDLTLDRDLASAMSRSATEPEPGLALALEPPFREGCCCCCLAAGAGGLLGWTWGVDETAGSSVGPLASSDRNGLRLSLWLLALSFGTGLNEGWTPNSPLSGAEFWFENAPPNNWPGLEVELAGPGGGAKVGPGCWKTELGAGRLIPAGGSQLTLLLPTGSLPLITEMIGCGVDANRAAGSDCIAGALDWNGSALMKPWPVKWMCCGCGGRAPGVSWWARCWGAWRKGAGDARLWKRDGGNGGKLVDSWLAPPNARLNCWLMLSPLDGCQKLSVWRGTSVLVENCAPLCAGAGCCWAASS